MGRADGRDARREVTSATPLRTSPARHVLVPKLFTTLRDYNRSQFASDLTAGVIVGIVALPLAIAFAIASGVSPERGLITAIVAGFLISALGGSRVQIGGPTGAFVVIVYGIVQTHGLQGLMVATVMAGFMLLAMGLARLGSVIKFVPTPLVTGFTSGIAVIIFSSQVKDFLGLQMGDVPANFLEKVAAYADHAGSASLPAIGVGALSMAIIIVWPRLNRRIPGPFVALIVATAVVHLAGIDVETVGSRFGTLAATIPTPEMPRLGIAELTALVTPAFSIALLGAVESLLSAVVADGMIGSRHRANMELVAQGVANIVTPLFGGIPATGAIARTATNVRNGGRTPVAGIVHAITLLLITLFFGRWAALIPMATLAAILVVVAYHMSEWRTFREELRAPKSDVAVLLTTFLLTVVVDLTVAIEIGMVLSAFLFMHRMSEVTAVNAVTRELAREASDERDVPLEELTSRRSIPDGVEVFEISGAFFFGAAEAFKETLTQVGRKPKVLIIRMRDVSLLDATGLRALRDVVHRSKAERTLVLVAEIHAQPLAALERSPAYDDLGAGQIYMTLEEALDRAREHLVTRHPTPVTPFRSVKRDPG
ncbi:MAG: STAS domain-containing protein [Gemmatimonadaceae bacterium]|nr:STAS domain-containing protein [Gemmatimonadaceae bacterium]